MAALTLGPLGSEANLQQVVIMPLNLCLPELDI